MGHPECGKQPRGGVDQRSKTGGHTHTSACAHSRTLMQMKRSGLLPQVSLGFPRKLPLWLSPPVGLCLSRAGSSGLNRVAPVDPEFLLRVPPVSRLTRLSRGREASRTQGQPESTRWALGGRTVTWDER